MCVPYAIDVIQRLVIVGQRIVRVLRYCLEQAVEIFVAGRRCGAAAFRTERRANGRFAEGIVGDFVECGRFVHGFAVLRCGRQIHFQSVNGRIGMRCAING